MKRRLHLLLAAVLCICLLMIPVTAGADFGGFSGSSDYGGGGGGGYSSGSDFDTGSSYNNNTYYYGGSSGGSSGGDDDTGIWIGIALVGAVFLISILVGVAKSKKGGAQPAGAQRTSAAMLRPMEEYTQVDAHFDAAALQEKLGNWYVQMQNGWQDKQIEELRPYFTDALYNQFEHQLEVFRQQKKTNYIENITVLGVNLRGFFQKEGLDHIIAELRTRIIDYTLDDATGNLVSGSKTAEKFMTYEWDLCRTTGEMTEQAGEKHAVNCPNCGAPLDINATTKCPYCGSIVTVTQHGWAICGMKGIAQQTVGK